MFFHSRSRSREFLGMIASDSHSRIVGMDFFHSLPVPEFWEWIFFIPFPFPNFGNRFFHSLPIPEFWEWFFFIPFPFPNWGNGFFQFPSRSRTSGMELSIPVPVPELPNVIPAHPCCPCIHLLPKAMVDAKFLVIYRLVTSVCFNSEAPMGVCYSAWPLYTLGTPSVHPDAATLHFGPWSFPVTNQWWLAVRTMVPWTTLHTLAARNKFTESKFFLPPEY